MFKISLDDVWNLPTVRPLKLKILNSSNVYEMNFITNQKELKNLLYQN